jgi:protein SCO1
MTPGGIDRRTAIAGAAFALLSKATSAHAAPVKAPVRLLEATMIDARSRRPVRLVRDVMADRLVALNFMFIGCSTICPMQSQILARTQKLVAKRLARDLVFVSITLSPLSDTPEKLARYAAQHDAGPGWKFLTGDFAETTKIREGFNAYARQENDHPPVFFIGRAGAPQWSRLYGMPRPELLAREIGAWSA